MREEQRERRSERSVAISHERNGKTHLIDDSSEHDPQLHEHIVRAWIKGRQVGIHKVVVGAIEKRRHRVLKEEQARAGDGAQLRGLDDVDMNGVRLSWRAWRRGRSVRRGGGRARESRGRRRISGRVRGLERA